VGAFSFRLQKVFEYRSLEEEWAKNFFLEKQVARIQAENDVDEILNVRKLFLQATRLELEIRLQKLDDRERASRLLVQQLQVEEEEARAKWILKKQEKGALETLLDKARVEWQHEEDLKEQQALDEWATQRRKVA
jgi:flagellar export protein FliJ